MDHLECFCFLEQKSYFSWVALLFTRFSVIQISTRQLENNIFKLEGYVCSLVFTALILTQETLDGWSKE